MSPGHATAAEERPRVYCRGARLLQRPGRHYEQGEVGEHLTDETVVLGDVYPSDLLGIVGIGKEANAAALQPFVGPGADDLSVEVGHKTIVLYGDADPVVATALERQRKRKLHAVQL